MGPADPELVLHNMSVALLVEPKSWALALRKALEEQVAGRAAAGGLEGTEGLLCIRLPYQVIARNIECICIFVWLFMWPIQGYSRGIQPRRSVTASTS